MQYNSPSSSSPSSSLRIGGISVTVPIIGDPGLAPSGISPRDPVPGMVETRASDSRRLEDMIAATMADFSAKVADVDRRREELDRLREQTDGVRDLTLKELREEFLALQVQQNEIMSRFVANAGTPAGAVAGGAPPRQQYFATRQSKVGFPIFNGDDLAGWLLRCDHFFAVDLTPEDAKVRLAIINLEGRALQWFKNWVRYQDQALNTPWPLFLQALECRFGDQLLGDLMTELLALKQTGSFTDYHDRFELLLGRVSLSKSYAISHFINGLKPFVQKSVRMFMPKTLVHAYALARLQELSSSGREGFSQGPKRIGANEYRSNNTSTPLLPTPIMPTVKTRRYLTPEEMADKRARGLCYGCDEKFERGHVCAKKLLYLLEIDDEVRELEGAEEIREEEVVEDDNPLISIHAINGSSSRGFKTMRITGRVGKKALHILIGSGSTHNFLDLQLAKRLGLHLTPVKPVMVDVADGNRLEYDAMCKGLKWVLRGTTFVTDVLLLPLGNCDMVLGIQWLETLVIQWDFKQLVLEFQLQGKRHVLRGSQSNQKIHTVTEKEMEKLISSCQGAQL